mmetsp:Transcript_7419/g.23197  ORF Transcript_7419/g.23197 Transcript_7419/m.23197 type:complete len:202 (+) Transcript_7419:375-980(+)
MCSYSSLPRKRKRAAPTGLRRAGAVGAGRRSGARRAQRRRSPRERVWLRRECVPRRARARGQVVRQVSRAGGVRSRRGPRSCREGARAEPRVVLDGPGGRRRRGAARARVARRAAPGETRVLVDRQGQVRGGPLRGGGVPERTLHGVRAREGWLGLVDVPRPALGRRRRIVRERLAAVPRRTHAAVLAVLRLAHGGAGGSR